MDFIGLQWTSMDFRGFQRVSVKLIFQDFEIESRWDMYVGWYFLKD
jgi:hypothetical protein